MRQVQEIKNWELVIRGEVYRKATITKNFYGEYKVDNGHIADMRFYKSYKACEKYLIKNGYKPVKEVA